MLPYFIKLSKILRMIFFKNQESINLKLQNKLFIILSSINLMNVHLSYNIN